MNASYFDHLETRDPEERERSLLQALPAQLAHAKAHSRAHAQRLAKVDPQSVTSRQALASLPILRKKELLEQQQSRGADPFAGYAVSGWSGLRCARSAKRVFQSPGPIYEPQGCEGDSWRIARAFHAAGFRRGDLVHNSFSYHLTPAGVMMEEGAHVLGCTVFPGGVGNTDLQLQAMADLQPHGYCGTPSFLRILLERAEQQNVALRHLRKALVSGEAFPTSLRTLLRERGIEAFECYATADIGLIAYETDGREGLVLDEHVIAEIVRPGTGDPVPPGEVGEVVITNFDIDYPLIRFGTGDLSAMLPGMCPTGRTQGRIKGWMGRADQTAKVRGMFVHPSQVAEIVRLCPEVAKARLEIGQRDARDVVSLQVETSFPSTDLESRLIASARKTTRLRVSVLCVPLESLPNDGKVIDDTRTHQ
jgi:phenylacetate-CoA ligase